jgi:hypothetical protein
MYPDVSKLLSEFIRSFVLTTTSAKIKASHARELVAAFFGYKSHAALLAEKRFPVNDLVKAEVLVPDVPLIASRRDQLNGLVSSIPPSMALARAMSDHLTGQKRFFGKVWLYESLEEYVREVLLHDEDAHIMDELSGVMAETNAYFDEAYYESADVQSEDDLVRIEVSGQYSGESDEDRMFFGDKIDMSVCVELYRVAGRVAFRKPDISATGFVNDDHVDPNLKYGSNEIETISDPLSADEPAPKF